MSGFLLDTNIISELMKPKPNSKVVAWVQETPEALMYLSVLTIGEIRKGIESLPLGDKKRSKLQSWLDQDVRLRFAGKILAFDEAVAERWGHIEASAKHQKITLSTVDAQLAATALHHNLTFATRNTEDVEPTGVVVYNPWR